MSAQSVADSRIADHVRYLVRRIDCSAGVVDNVVDTAITVEKNRQDVVEFDPRGDRDLEGA